MNDETSTRDARSLFSQGIPPRWKHAPSPWQVPWSEVIEHSEWYRLFSHRPPFAKDTPLSRILIRRHPREIPRALFASAPPTGLLESPLGLVMDAGPAAVLENLRQIQPQAVEALLDSLESGEPELDWTECLPLLLSPAADRQRRRLLGLASQRTRRYWGGRVLLYAPIYLSNACTNLCTYCGFNVKNAVPRVTLSLEQLRLEAEVLLSQGLRHVLLLTGEAPKQVGTEQVIAAARVLEPRFASVSLEVFPMSEADYGECTEIGVRGLTLYQETYAADLYRQVHRGGRKRNLLWRLAAPERAARAGFRKIGMGALLGLGPWRYEALALGLHAMSLAAQFPDLALTLSFPRLRPAAGQIDPPAPVTDEELKHLMAALRLALPQAGFVLSTRESAELRDELAPTVVTQMSAGSSTEPGGYASQESTRRELPQFEIIDRRTICDVRQRLRELGLQPD